MLNLEVKDRDKIARECDEESTENNNRMKKRIEGPLGRCVGADQLVEPIVRRWEAAGIRQAEEHNDKSRDNEKKSSSRQRISVP